MITFLEGVITEKQPARVVINVGGVGYEVFIPISSYDRLPAQDQTCRLLTYHHVREDAQLLYGFSTEAERRMFLLLLTVNGIGPKLALSVLSGLTVRELKAAVVGGDVKMLSSVSGIGKKTAERVVVELRDKLSAGESLEAVAGAPALSAEDTKTRDAILALISLGYKQAEAQKMIQGLRVKLTAKATVEELVKAALTG